MNFEHSTFCQKYPISGINIQSDLPQADFCCVLVTSSVGQLPQRGEGMATSLIGVTHGEGTVLCRTNGMPTEMLTTKAS